MSTIVKALKKLEEEKRQRPEVSTDITREILSPPPSRRVAPAMIAGAAALAVLLMVSATWLLARSYFLPRSPSPSMPVASPPPVATSPSVAETPAAASAPSVVGNAAPAPRAGAPAAAGKPSVAARPKTAPAAKRTVRQPVQRFGSAAPAASAPSAPAAPPAATPSPAPQVSPEPERPALKVSGIAYGRDDADRYAVVNGSMVRENQKVAGAVVEAILPDRVRFSVGGRTFDSFLAARE